MKAVNLPAAEVHLSDVTKRESFRQISYAGMACREHFIGLGCMGIYVTHLKELASAHPHAVSLRAMLDENKCPTYQIRRGEAAENASAEKLVEKHRLTYRQLKERL